MEALLLYALQHVDIAPCVGPGHPFPLFPALVHSPPHLLLFFTFPIFLFSFALLIFFFRPSRPLFYQSIPTPFPDRRS